MNSLLLQEHFFAADGSMLPCTDKSKLIHNLEKLAKTDDTEIPAANEYGDSSAM